MTWYEVTIIFRSRHEGGEAQGKSVRIKRESWGREVLLSHLLRLLSLSSQKAPATKNSCLVVPV